ncbi:MAG: hypothetical protein ACTSPQ_09415 [Candidatus Helarchaeota archaeon]
MLKKFVAGSTLMMTLTGIIISLFGVAPFLDKPKRTFIDTFLFLVAIANIGVSILLIYKNLNINFISELIEPGLDPEENLKSASYFLGIIFGYFISMMVCYIIWLLSSTLSGKIQKEFLENNIFKIIKFGVGIGILIVKLMELIYGGFSAPGLMSRLLGINIFWLVFVFLIITATFLTISLIATRDDTTPKYIKMCGTCLGILSFIFLIIFHSVVPKGIVWATMYGILNV